MMMVLIEEMRGGPGRLGYYYRGTSKELLERPLGSGHVRVRLQVFTATLQAADGGPVLGGTDPLLSEQAQVLPVQHLDRGKPQALLEHFRLGPHEMMSLC
ncbi:hypothetical protein [Methylorubrum aminovorans]